MIQEVSANKCCLRSNRFDSGLDYADAYHICERCRGGWGVADELGAMGKGSNLDQRGEGLHRLNFDLLYACATNGETLALKGEGSARHGDRTSVAFLASTTARLPFSCCYYRSL